MKSARTVRPAWVVAGASGWIATVANIPLWRAMDSLELLATPAGWSLAAALALMMAGCLAAVMSLLAWRATLKPVVIVLLAIAAVGGYFMFAYNIVIDSAMLVNVLETDAHEAADLWSVWMPVSIALVAGVPAWMIWVTPVHHAPWTRQLARNLSAAVAFLVLAVVAVMLAFQPLASSMRNHKQLRYMMNPMNSLYAAGLLATSPLRRGPMKLAALGTDAAIAPSPTGKPPLMVLVLGETGRSGNFSINGYSRNTTPELQALNVASSTNAWSCGTSTAASVPCMFSHLGQKGFQSRTQDNENLLDVLRHAGLAVLWIDNQAGCKGVCDRVASASTSAAADPQLCDKGECFDGILLEGIDARIAALPAEARARGVVLVLHQMGSHGPAYARRSPAQFKRFQPECRSSNLQECSREEVVNAYDNSIAYTDHFLASTIHWLKGQGQRWDTAMVYVADHGESLGENNLYLHGLPYALAPDVQKRVPWITWLSPGFESRSGVTIDCVKKARGDLVTHDNYFHSVLGLLDVTTSAYDSSLNAYRACQRETDPSMAQLAGRVAIAPH
ncbi:phosphoethanolamine transferase [Caenimonas sp. SL110]|uniref:phosphoethanolamine transferase n=1 Tax=Caenimonas sp. SL110 TaxID=1450524 RepID=UPI000AE942AC|nr:phosphoethanolamine--lipid A transferase [Caenimonas sp. SL110]